jgi:hypothetical protein
MMSPNQVSPSLTSGHVGSNSKENTIASVKGRLAAEDHKEAIKGSLDFSKTNLTPSSFIATGLELEAAQ